MVSTCFSLGIPRSTNLEAYIQNANLGYYFHQTYGYVLQVSRHSGVQM